MSPPTPLELDSPVWVDSFSVRAVYEELSNTLAAIDEQEDLRWWRNTQGPGMATDWPHFQVNGAGAKGGGGSAKKGDSLSL